MKVALGVGAVVVVILIVVVVLYYNKPATDEPQTASDPEISQPVSEPAESGPPPRIVWRAAQDAFLNENAKRDGWSQTPEGLQYQVEKEASGDAPKPAPGSRVTVHYEGQLINGNVFDSSYARGEPATFPLSGVIQGWQVGVPMMRLGEIWQFAIPAELGYGERDSGPIPAGSTLLFKVELLEVETPAN
tara:strand:- start:2291 stop:2857 length:567 start_codon:yes stop_codon:yes gene_type:complete